MSSPYVGFSSKWSRGATVGATHESPSLTSPICSESPRDPGPPGGTERDCSYGLLHLAAMSHPHFQMNEGFFAAGGQALA